MAEEGTVSVGEVSIAYAIERRPRRRKTIEMRMDGVLSVRIAAPPRTPVATIEAFVRDRVRWIVARGQQTTPAPATPRLPEEVAYRGRPLCVEVKALSQGRPAVAVLGEAIEISVPEGLDEDEHAQAAARALHGWYVEAAAIDVQAAIDKWAHRVGRRPARVFIRNQKRRWGSCARDGTLRFNWRVVTIEPELLEYVVVHELVHLEVMDHSKAYWARVGELLPDYRERRKRLRRAEATLAFQV